MFLASFFYDYIKFYSHFGKNAHGKIASLRCAWPKNDYIFNAKNSIGQTISGVCFSSENKNYIYLFIFCKLPPTVFNILRIQVLVKFSVSERYSVLLLLPHFTT